MIDIHTHLLAGVDDGSESLEESVAMAELAVRSGVSAVIVTPHYDVPEDPVIPLARLRTQFLDLRSQMALRGIPLKIYSGMEIFGTEETAERLHNGNLMTLAGSRYPLIEFPFSNFGREATRILQSVCNLGLTPIVAHPERYRYTQTDPELLNLWFDMGCLFQINRGSLLGRFGRESSELADSMLERRFAGFIASDAHGEEFRTPWLKDIREAISREYSPDYARLLLHDLPEHVLEDREIIPDEPDWF